jgi:hypothetical protein
MKTIVFHMDNEDFDKLLDAKKVEAKAIGKPSLSWLEYFLILSEIENGSRFDRNGNLIKK